MENHLDFLINTLDVELPECKQYGKVADATKENMGLSSTLEFGEKIFVTLNSRSGSKPCSKNSTPNRQKKNSKQK